MKFLYRILRLFFCPHRWILMETLTRKENNIPYAKEKVCRCKYCGSWKVFKAGGQNV